MFSKALFHPEIASESNFDFVSLGAQLATVRQQDSGRFLESSEVNLFDHSLSSVFSFEHLSSFDRTIPILQSWPSTQ